MAIHGVRASGLEYLALATELLQRVRLADAATGVWEAADLQWWWRTPRRSLTLNSAALVRSRRRRLRVLGREPQVQGQRK